MVAIESRGSLGEELDALGLLADKARHENFPVASRILPSEVRTHLMAIYAFARLADDIGDEARGDRLALLAWLESELDRAAAGNATHPVLVQLSPVIRGLDLSLTPFRCLIESNRVDQRVKRYRTFDDLVSYCMLSAAPVGRLVLAVFGVSTHERIALSDRVCIGLQLVEHLQDVGEDARRGRLYLPLEDMERFGCAELELFAMSSGPALRGLVAMEARRARGLLAAGAPLAASLPIRERAAVVGFCAGGTAALDAIDRAGDDVLRVRCRPSRVGFARRALPAFVRASLTRGGE